MIIPRGPTSNYVVRIKEIQPNGHPRVSSDWDLFASGGSHWCSLGPGACGCAPSCRRLQTQTQVGGMPGGVHAAPKPSRPGCIGIGREGWLGMQTPPRLHYAGYDVTLAKMKGKLARRWSNDSSLIARTAILGLAVVMAFEFGDCTQLATTLDIHR